MGMKGRIVMSKMYNGECGGLCYKCRCTGCKGECAMHCFVSGNTEEIAIMNDEEDYVKECLEFTLYEE